MGEEMRPYLRFRRKEMQRALSAIASTSSYGGTMPFSPTLEINRGGKEYRRGKSEHVLTEVGSNLVYYRRGEKNDANKEKLVGS